MPIERRLAHWLLERYPEEAVGALLSMSDADAGALVDELTPAAATVAVRCLGSRRAAALTPCVSKQRMTEILGRLPPPLSASLLRHLDPRDRQAMLEMLSGAIAEALKRCLSFPADTAGALMDSRILALPSALLVREALRELRRRPADAVSYVYAVDDESRLVGVTTVGKLVVAKSGQRLASIVRPTVAVVAASASSKAVVTHVGWQSAHELPVVDGERRLLGVIAYPTLRKMQRGTDEPEAPVGMVTASALGDLFWTGMAGIVGAIAATGRVPKAEDLERRGTR